MSRARKNPSNYLALEYSREISALISYLVSVSLIDSQSVPALRDKGNGILVVESDYWAEAPRMLGAMPYEDLYTLVASSGSYDMRFLDGSLVQLQYEFQKTKGLRRSRVSFLPSPHLSSFQDDPDLYLGDELFGDVVDKGVVTVPLRFDYDHRDDVHSDLDHPISHFTIGQYPNCRIPVSSVVTPYYFIEFILRAFYATPKISFTDKIPAPKVAMSPTITKREQSFLHVAIGSLGLT